MNYLAHLFLAENTPESRLGNLLGDFVKGNLDNFKTVYSPQIIQGIKIHQKIDYFTDRHPIFKQSKQRISEKNRRYAGVIIDIYYDHFLSKNWLTYSNQDLEIFVTQIYQMLETYKSLLPDKLKNALPRMIQEDWLGSYRYLTGIDQTFSRLSRRIKRHNNIAFALEDLITHYSLLEEDFVNFFPQLVDYTNSLS
ncbi:protein of unknown function DUF479 [Gloeothece citriformis PCC 7424]|uniref:Acyl carrier protein phosphodiesterase n=1 Tax=Gloeothece citriformis (strain PCC 7424) TaxID=65393 RepID=B7KDQ0_GLOC7|nr:ACP phosphodiesterase [Gloeothece citriformis]ACK70352.1 protein of unknown function DUF479 [Gloeothece citriformis PCC 7424]